MQAVKLGQLGEIRRVICQLTVTSGLRHQGVQDSALVHIGDRKAATSARTCDHLVPLRS